MDQFGPREFAQLHQPIAAAVMELADPTPEWSAADPTPALVRVLAHIARRHPERTSPATKTLARLIDAGDPVHDLAVAPAPAWRLALAV